MIDAMVSAFNGIALIVLSLPLLYVSVSPAFKTGIVLTLGIGAMGLSAAICGVWELNGIDPWELKHLARAQAIGLGGLALCAVRMCARPSMKRHPRRRSTDWTDLASEGARHARDR